MNVNLKMSFVILYFLLSIPLATFSQNAKIDSLKRIVEFGTKDTLMVMTLNDLSKALLFNKNISESITVAKQSYKLANNLNYLKGKAYALKAIGMSYYYQGDYLSVLDYWTKSLQNFELIQDNVGIANMVNNLGAVYYSRGSNAKAIDYYLRSLRASEKLNDSLRIATALINIGGVYADNPRDYDKALDYYKKVKTYLKTIKDPSLQIAYFFANGEIKFAQEKFEEALIFYEEALKISKGTAKYSANLINLGKTRFKLGERDKAIENLNKAYVSASADSLQLQVVKSLIELGNVYQDNDISKSLNAYSEAEKIAKDIGLNYEIRDIYEGISKAYTNKKDYKNALNYQTKLIAQNNSLFNLETDDKIRSVQFDFDLQKKEDQIGLLEKESEIQQLKEKRQKIIIYSSGVAIVLIVLLAVSLFRRYKYVKETNLIIEEEKNRSEKLLHNILPEETALELKQNGRVQAKKFDQVTVLFTDFKGFTHFAKDLSPEALVNSVDYYFSKFDEIMKKYGLEKIKTIGDAYMCAGGLPFATDDHAVKMVLAAFEIIDFIDDTKKNLNRTITHFDVRIGINTGSVVAGVVGIHKFAYDIWGDTVNVASRMETLSKPGRINISENTYKLVKNHFTCKYRGEIEVKNRGFMKMYFVNGIKETLLNNTLAKK